MKEKNIQELAIRMGLITVEDMCQYTIAQLVVKIANKVNELVGEVWRFETDVQEILKTQNENIQYLLGEGLHLEVGNIFDGWVQDGTFDTLINHSALKKVNERIDENSEQLTQTVKQGQPSSIELNMLSQSVKEVLTGGSVAVVGAEMVDYINMNESSVKLDTLNEEIFNDKTVKTYNATYTSPFTDSTKKYFPSSVLVTLNSSKLVENVTVKAKLRNVENVTKVQPRVECGGTVIQGTELNVSNACEINQIINVNKTSDRVRVYFFVQGSVDDAKYQIIDIDISVNGTKTDINTIGELAVSFGVGTISSQIKKYKGVASREYVNSVVNSVDWTNQKLIVYGDSISDDDFFTTKSHYYDYISQKTGIKTESYAVGGSGFAYNSTVTQSIQKWGATNNMLHQIDRYGNGSPKFVVVECGTNDWGFTTCDLGVIDDILDDNSTTFYGNVGKACRKLKTKFPYSKILFCTLLPRYDVTNYMCGKVNNKGNTMKQFSQAIKDVCEAYSINVLDMYAKSQLFNPDVQSEWWHDRLHPSEKYHEEVFSELVLNELKSM